MPLAVEADHRSQKGYRELKQRARGKRDPIQAGKSLTASSSCSVHICNLWFQLPFRGLALGFDRRKGHAKPPPAAPRQDRPASTHHGPKALNQAPTPTRFPTLTGRMIRRRCFQGTRLKAQRKLPAAPRLRWSRSPARAPYRPPRAASQPVPHRDCRVTGQMRTPDL